LSYVMVLALLVIGVGVGFGIGEYVLCLLTHNPFNFQSPADLVMANRGDYRRLPEYGMAAGFFISWIASRGLIGVFYFPDSVDELFSGPRKTYKPGNIELDHQNIIIRLCGEKIIIERKHEHETETFPYRRLKNDYSMATRLFFLFVILFILGSNFGRAWMSTGHLPFTLSFVGVAVIFLAVQQILVFVRYKIQKGEIEMSREGIAQINGFGKRSFLLWSDIRELVERRGALEVLNERGKVVVRIMDQYDQSLKMKTRIFEEYKLKGR